MAGLFVPEMRTARGPDAAKSVPPAPDAEAAQRCPHTVQGLAAMAALDGENVRGQKSRLTPPASRTPLVASFQLSIVAEQFKKFAVFSTDLIKQEVLSVTESRNSLEREKYDHGDHQQRERHAAADQHQIRNYDAQPITSFITFLLLRLSSKQNEIKIKLITQSVNPAQQNTHAIFVQQR